ncbi:MAG: GTP pyrophosphokinase, partial [Planctomycetota bacterium]
MSDLQRAIEIAVSAHRGQTRKDGSPYVLHPLRLMMSVNASDERIVALLHDVVEDTSITSDDLEREGFSEHVLAALRLLTHDPEVSYEDYIQRLATNQLARTVKLADLRDNSNVFELPSIGERDLRRVEKYHRAFKFLSR